MSLLTCLTVALAAFGGFASAEKLNDCSGSCVGKAIEFTGCASVDSHCICSSPSFMTTVTECAIAGCSSADQEECGQHQARPEARHQASSQREAIGQPFESAGAATTSTKEAGASASQAEADYLNIHQAEAEADYFDHYQTEAEADYFDDYQAQAASYHEF
ncbi:hypothetical protein LTR53_012516 [Teratosphaeriaceae sp. CCFEE 6253]|nr:hypothetical protein LTR53_012516 [Teratosphaeriaceae sp. CCFEE 6253]